VTGREELTTGDRNEAYGRDAKFPDDAGRHRARIPRLCHALAVSLSYLHGDRPEERERLRRQAAFLACKVHDGLPFGSCRRLLEVGCGVGAQSEILLQSFPGSALVGIDVNPVQVDAAARRLEPRFGARATFRPMDARQLTFDPASFDGAFICWLLEHVSDPGRVVAEARRVLEHGAPLVCTEVLNATLFVHPPSPHLDAYWAAYNEHQVAIGGDPYVGAKLGNLLAGAGFRDVTTHVLSYLLDDRDPEARADMFAYFTELLLSAAPGLIESGRIGAMAPAALRDELCAAGRAPNGVFFYSVVRATARA
jgi:SAM-dependent methyltransferase